MTQLNGFGRNDGPCLVFHDRYPVDGSARVRFDNPDRSFLYTSPGYHLVRPDHVGSSGRGCVIYYGCGDGDAPDFDLCKRENIRNPAIILSATKIPWSRTWPWTTSTTTAVVSSTMATPGWIRWSCNANIDFNYKLCGKLYSYWCQNSAQQQWKITKQGKWNFYFYILFH